MLGKSTLLICEGLTPIRFFELSLKSTPEEKISSEVKPKTLSPVWNEEFEMKVVHPGDIIRIKLYHKGDISRRHKLGSAYIPVRLLENGFVHDLMLTLTNMKTRHIPIDDSDDLNSFLAKTRSSVSTGDEQPKQDPKPRSNSIFDIGSKIKKPSESISFMGYISVQIHYYARHSDFIQYDINQLPDMFEQYKHLLERLMIAARMRTTQKGAIGIPADSKILLDEFAARYSIGDFFRKMCYLELVLADFLARTNDKKSQEDDQPPPSFISQISVSSKAGEIVLTLYNHNNNTKKSFYTRLRDSLEECLKTPPGKRTLTESGSFEKLLRKTTNRLASMICNYTYSFGDSGSIGSLHHAIDIFESLFDEYVDFLETLQQIIVIGIQHRYSMISSKKTGDQPSLLVECTRHAFSEAKLANEVYCRYFPTQLGEKSYVSIVIETSYKLLHLDVRKYFASVPTDGDRIFDLYHTILELHDYITPLDILKTRELIPVLNYFRRFIDAWVLKTSGNLLKWTQNAIDIENFQPITGGVLYSSSARDVFAACYSAFDFVAKLRPDCSTYIQLSTAVIGVVRDYLQKIFRVLLEKLAGSDEPTSSHASFRLSTVPIVSLLVDEGDDDVRSPAAFSVTMEMCVIMSDAHVVVNKLSELLDSLLLVNVSQEDKEVIETEVFHLRKSTFVKLDDILRNMNSAFLDKFSTVIYSGLDHVLDSPLSSGISAEERLEPLLELLNTQLTTLSNHLIDFSTTVLPSIWNLILQGIEHMCTSHLEGHRSISSKDDAHIMIEAFLALKDYFHAGGDGLSHELLDSSGDNVIRLLNLYNMSTHDLIQLHNSPAGSVGYSPQEILTAISRRHDDHEAEKYVKEKTHKSDDQSEFRRRFGLSHTEVLIGAYPCSNSLGLRGRVYVMSSCICFEPLIFSSKSSRIQFPMKDITKFKKAKFLGVMENALKFTLASGQVHFFYAFLTVIGRNEAYASVCRQSAKAGVILDPYFKDPSSETSSQRRRASVWELKSTIAADSGEKDLKDLFKLDYKENLIASAECNYFFHGYWREGTLYLYDKHLCFYSHMLVHTLVKVIPLEELTAVNKLDPLAFGILQYSGIEGIVKKGGKDREYVWRGMQNRDALFRDILRYWRPENQDPEGDIMSYEEEKKAADAKELFGLAKKEKVIDTFSCSNSVCMHGLLYILAGHLCFAPSIAISQKIVIPMKSIRGVRRGRFLLLDTAIEVWDQTGQCHLFHGFLNRQTTLDSIESRLKANGINLEIDEMDDVYRKKGDYKEFFKIPEHDDDDLVARFACSYTQVGGYLWIGKLRVCFGSRSNTQVRFVILFSQLKSIKKPNSFESMDSLELSTQDGKVYVLKGVADRESAYEEIMEHFQHDETDAFADSLRSDQEARDMQQRFGLDLDDKLIRTVGCTNRQTGAQGYLHVSTKSLCFEPALIPDASQRLIIPISLLVSAEKGSAIASLDAGIEITTTKNQTFSFSGLNNTSEVLRMIQNQMQSGTAYRPPSLSKGSSGSHGSRKTSLGTTQE
eukprot:TRINITY_DN4178_c0_g1_i1.p1 TRINITY_DN4178_c0_g1~~TRINITY_DN4178_c0_g1_i1.p1  ORF type:complete len:1523 (-),score=308.51 TRINITY_DN4178_c0_g1_i1:119-4687(-)